MKYKIGDIVRFVGYKMPISIGGSGPEYHDKHKDHQHGNCNLRENKLLVKDVMEDECLLEFETIVRSAQGNFFTRLVFKNEDIEHYHAIDLVQDSPIINSYQIY